MTTPSTQLHSAHDHASVDELLTAYAAGTTSPGLSLLCAAHLTLRPDNRAFVEMAEEIGGALLGEERRCGNAAAELAPMDFDALLARVDADEAEPRAASLNGGGPMPQPVLRAVGASFDDIPWRKRLGGVAEYGLEGFEHEKVSLLRARPGARIPKHTHQGLEATLVLQGVLRDGGNRHLAGDIALAGPEDDHIPEIEGDEICYCLVVNDGALRFTGTFGRALNLFAE